MAERTCSELGCDKAHRARGLCSTHYNEQHQPNRHAKVTVACGYCGEPCQKHQTAKYQARYCTAFCRDLAGVERKGYEAMHTPEARARAAATIAARTPTVGPRTRIPWDHPARWYGARTPLLHTACAICSVPICTNAASSRVYCSRKCKSRAKHLRERVLGTRSQRHMRRRVEVYTRDDWTCWLCGGPTSRAWSLTDPLSPTLDHVLPRSLGGDDSLDNLATAHFVCNTNRGASDVTTHPRPLAA